VRRDRQRETETEAESHERQTDRQTDRQTRKHNYHVVAERTIEVERCDLRYS
jgi:hypothetical protein